MEEQMTKRAKNEGRTLRGGETRVTSVREEKSVGTLGRSRSIGLSGKVKFVSSVRGGLSGTPEKRQTRSSGR